VLTVQFLLKGIKIKYSNCISFLDEVWLVIFNLGYNTKKKRTPHTEPTSK